MPSSIFGLPHVHPGWMTPQPGLLGHDEVHKMVKFALSFVSAARRCSLVFGRSATRFLPERRYKALQVCGQPLRANQYLAVRLDNDQIRNAKSGYNSVLGIDDA